MTTGEGDYYRLRTEWLRFKSHLQDGLTGLPALPAVAEEARRLLETHGGLEVAYLDLGRSGWHETKLGWAAYDDTIREFAKKLAAMRDGGALRPEDIVCLHTVRSDRFLILSGRGIEETGPGLKDRVQRLTRYQPLPAYDKPDDPAWRLMKAILVRWSQEARAPVVIVPVPLYQYVEKSASARAYQARFGELAELPGVTIHDPLPEFHRHTRAQRRSFRFVHDCHLTGSAHRVLAESLAHAVRALLPVGGSRAA